MDEGQGYGIIGENLGVAWVFGTQVCGSLELGTCREWLAADGCGGYAMGTVSGLRSRRYHGLLVTAGDIPGRRMVALASLDPVLTLPSGAKVRLATHEWASGAIDPRGHELLERFELRDGIPRWRWRVGDVVLERVLAMRYGSPSLAVVHRLVSGGPVGLAVEPICTWRDAHGERRAASGLRVEQTADGAIVEDAYRIAGPGFELDGEWYLGAYHREEAARGLEPVEDLFRVGRFNATLRLGESLEISAWTGDGATLATSPPAPREVVAAARQRALALTAGDQDSTAGALNLAADAFIVGTGTGVDVVAGYPWFGAWSRDTMISYEGLFLATGRADEGRALLRAHGRTLSDGMLANTADAGRTEYNTADATLWFLHAVDRHVAATGDDDLAAELVGPLDAVVRWHLEGTRFGIRVDPADGLLTQGAPGYALTWMDAVVGGVPVTPRHGKAVELNALWINGLAALAGLHQRLGRDTADLDARRATATRSFRRRFPAPMGWLYDLVDSPVSETGPRNDDGLRPNQLLAYALPNGPMRGTDPEPVRAVGRALLTPLGLRSLAPDVEDYRGVHQGDPASRDRAYHQGTVWPWLIGPYADAATAVGISTDRLLDGLVAHIGEWGVGSVSETADGDAPHRATGCPFQAWSVAETCRIYRQGRAGPGSTA
jgi:predicted glycogen debranching enzyme